MNVWKTVLAGLVTVLCSQSALATPTIVNGKYYDERGTCSTSAAYGCTMYFSAVPAGKFLKITNVSCWVRASSTYVMDRIELFAAQTSGGSGGRYVYLDLGSYNYQISFYFYRMNQQTQFVVGPTRFPGIRFSTNSSGDTLADCVIAGELL